jgi:hypothetical protein
VLIYDLGTGPTAATNIAGTAFDTVGTPVAQVVFHTATPTDAAYEGATRYQHAGAVKFLPKPLKIRRPGEG